MIRPSPHPDSALRIGEVTFSNSNTLFPTQMSCHGLKLRDSPILSQSRCHKPLPKSPFTKPVQLKTTPLSWKVENYKVFWPACNWAMKKRKGYTHLYFKLFTWIVGHQFVSYQALKLVNCGRGRYQVDHTAASRTWPLCPAWLLTRVHLVAQNVPAIDTQVVRVSKPKN